MPTRAQNFATLVIAVAWLGYLLLAISWAAQSYRNTMKAAEDRVSSSSLVVATHAQWVTEFAGQATRRIADVAQGEQSRYRDIVESVESAVLGLPGSVKVYIVDAAGNTRFSTDPDVKPVDITDRGYFKKLKEGAPDYVSSLLISRLNGEQIFVFSRRLEKDGIFDGTVNLSLSVEIMKPIWDAVDLGGDFAVSFIRDDGQLVARYPKAEKPLDMSGYVLFTRYIKEAPVGTYASEASPLDGVQRIVGFRKVEGTPFVAIAAGDLTLLMHPFWRTVTILAIVTALACLASISAAWRIRSLVRVQEMQSTALAAALDRNQFLLREIHHRVKNNLQSVMSLVRLHLAPGEKSQALTDRIRAMVEVHQLIYQHDSYLAIDAALLVRAVTKSVVSSFGSGVTPQFDLEPAEVSNDRATALALLVNEVLSNSLKYGTVGVEEPELHVSLQSSNDAGYFWLQVKDNGPGFDSATIGRGTGTKLIEGSVRQLDGTFTLSSDNGAVFKAHVRLFD
ncbi:hypothetical protein ASC71_20620 [Rhizobium sp. Root1240]|nr:hypothetical protein ASC71_20620 [Rhizobium sp. Root1240]